MHEALENILRERIDEYTKLHDNKFIRQQNDGEFPDPTPEEQKNLCITALEGRMELLDENDGEYKECAFLKGALSSGWLVSDIDMLRTMHGVVQKLPAGKSRASAEKLLGQIAGVKMDTLASRFQMTMLLQQRLSPLTYDFPELKLTKDMLAITSHLNGYTVYPAEYPRDKEFKKTGGLENDGDGVSYGTVRDDNKRYDKLFDGRDEAAREKADYILDEVTDAEREAEEQKPFVPHAAQLHNNITKTAKQAVCEVLGSEIYDEIDEMHRGEVKDRRVKIHHSLGTKHQKQGEDVLELEFAGSGGKDTLKKHKDHDGDIVESRFASQEEAEAFYGKKALKPNGKEYFDYIRYKEKTMTLPDGSTSAKTRYSFAGPTPDLKYWPGIPNVGEYSVENTRENARYYAAQFIAPRFEKWLKGEKEPKRIRIDLSGHSRGAVTAGQTAKLIDAWITEYIKKHPEAKDFKDRVSYDLRLRDPVPGMITDLHLGSCTLKGIPNINTTVICSLGISSKDLACPLQHVRGANKLILTTDDHPIDTLEQDESQLNTLGDEKKHARAFYDAETGEMHRGSGLNELPDGIYAADEKRNLIRITSFSQVHDLFGAVYDKSSPQRIRARRIHKMVRDWFIENELEMSFPDERTRKQETAKNHEIQNKILRVGAKRMEPVQEEIRRLQDLKEKNAGKEELIAQNKKLIEACRTYMKNTGMPPAGHSAYKVGLVGDTLSFTMRENNQLAKELRVERGEASASELDDKIKAQQDRLEKKPGCLERKMAAEQKRLAQEQSVLDLINDTAKYCKDALKTLDATRVGKSNSTGYEQMHKMLEVGSKLGPQTNLYQMSEFLKLVTKTSNNYSASHDKMFGPVTDDGKTRLQESRAIGAFGVDTAEKLKKLSAGLGDKNTPFGMRIEHRSDNLKYLEQRRQERKGPEKQSAINPEQQPAVNTEKQPAAQALST